MNSTTGVAAPAGDPPVPNRTTRISSASSAVKTKDNINLGIMAAIVIAASALCFYTKHSIAGYVLAGLALVLMGSLFAKKSDVGQCPYCMAQFRETVSVKNGLLHCEQCGEYSQVANKIVKPLDPATYSESAKFESAVFKQGSMPNACAACGAPATRLDTVSTSSVNKTLAVAGAARLMTGAPGVAIFSSTHASISIPYCDQHCDAVTLGFDWRKRPLFQWLIGHVRISPPRHC